MNEWMKWRRREEGTAPSSCIHEHSSKHTCRKGGRKKRTMEESVKTAEIIWRKQEAFGDVNRKMLFSRPFSVALTDQAFLFPTECGIDTAFSYLRSLLSIQEWVSPAMLKKEKSVTRKRRANCTRKEPSFWLMAQALQLEGGRRSLWPLVVISQCPRSTGCFSGHIKEALKTEAAVSGSAEDALVPAWSISSSDWKVESECMTKSPKGTISVSFSGRIKRIQLQNHSDQS